MGDWLNYHHLFYFWTTVREGGVSAASRRLRLTQPTVSEQIKELESTLGVALFLRRGRRLVLTDTGSHVYRYADEIFSLGRELVDTLAGRTAASRARLVVGIADVMPKLIVGRLLEPALQRDPLLRMVCYEDRHERLLSDLALYELDVVLTDTPMTPDSNFPGFSRLLGESAVSLFAKPKLAERLRKGFPKSLEDVPLLLPIEHTSLRLALTRWFETNGIRPRIRGEFQDSALLMAFGRSGEGIFAAPSVIAEEIMTQHRLEVVAELEGVRERFYAVTAERKITHPGVRAITELARTQLS
jgi:LysR family transcriptional regulator, transcriptional activator of nhaA